MPIEVGPGDQRVDRDDDVLAEPAIPARNRIVAYAQAHIQRPLPGTDRTRRRITSNSSNAGSSLVSPWSRAPRVEDRVDVAITVLRAELPCELLRLH